MQKSSFLVFQLHRYTNHMKSLTVTEKIFQGKTKKENYGKPAFASDEFSLLDKALIPSGQDSSILPARVANHSARFGSSCPLTELVI